jgi:hypothetical protein
MTALGELSAMVQRETNWSNGSYVAHDLCNRSQYANYPLDRFLEESIAFLAVKILKRICKHVAHLMLSG